MSDNRAEQNEWRHSQREHISGIVYFIDDEVCASPRISAVGVIKPADEEATDWQKPNQNRVAIPGIRRPFKRNEKYRGRDA